MSSEKEISAESIKKKFKEKIINIYNQITKGCKNPNCYNTFCKNCQTSSLSKYYFNF